MDGSDRCMDNTRIEQPWPSREYEAAYLHQTAEGFTARRPIRRLLAHPTERA